MELLVLQPTSSIICSYVNASSKVQVARITNLPGVFFERTIFPGQRILFQTQPTAQLEIHTGLMASSILSDTIACDRLQILDDLKKFANQ
jgi:hypothetical protein